MSANLPAVSPADPAPVSPPEQRAPRRSWTMLGIAVLALLITVALYLQHNAAIMVMLTGRQARIYSIQAFGQQAAGQAEQSFGLSTASAWYEMGKLTAAASRAGNADGVQRYRQAQERLAQISPLFSKAYNLDVKRWEADLYITRTVELSERAAAAAQTSDAWGNKQGVYLAVTMLLAAALLLLALAKVTNTSRFLTLAALVMTALAVAMTVSALTTTASVRPESAILAYARGAGLAWQGSPQEAIEEYNIALKQSPDYVSALLARGDAWQAQGDYARALTDYLSARSAGRDDATAAYKIGWSYYMLGQFENAIRANQRALELRPDMFPAQFNNALFQLAVDRLDGARAVYTAAQVALAAQVEEARRNDPAAPYVQWSILERAAQDVDNLLDQLGKRKQAWTQAPPLEAISNPADVSAAAQQIVIHLKNLNAALEYTGKPQQDQPEARISPLAFGMQLDRSKHTASSNTAVVAVNPVQPRAPYEAAMPAGSNPQTFYPRASTIDIATAAGDIMSATHYEPLTEVPQDQLDSLLVLFQYDRMQDGTPVLWKVYSQGEEVLSLRKQQTWDLGAQGNAQKGFTFVFASPGEYSVEMYVDNHLIRRGSFAVMPPIVADPDSSAIVTSTAGSVVISDDPALTFQNDRLTRIGLGVMMQAAWSPNSAQVAVASSIGVYVLDAATLNMQRFIESDKWVTPLVYLSDDKTLVTGNADGKLVYYDAATGAITRTIEAHTGQVLHLAYSAQANLVASAGDDHIIKLWDASSGELREQLDGHSDEITSIAFDESGARLASGSRDKTVRIWDTRKFASLLTIQTGSAVMSVALSPNGQLLAVAGIGVRSVNVYNTANNKLAFSLSTANENVNSVQFTADGSQIVTAGDSGVVQTWNASSAASPLREMKGSVGILHATISPNGKTMLLQDDNRAVTLWDLATQKTTGQSMTFGSYINALAFMPDGSALAIGDHTGIVEVRDVSNGFIMAGSLTHDLPVTGIVFNPVSNQVATAGQDKLVKLWDTKFAELQFSLIGHEDTVASIAYSPDGTLLASGSWDKTIKLWDPRAGKLIKTLTGHAYEVLSVAFSPDGKRLISGSRDKTVKVWDVATGDLLGTLDGHTDTVLAVAYSQDNRYIASAGVDETIRIWDAQNGTLLRAITDGGGPIYALAFSPDSARIASGGDDPLIKLWDVNSGERIASFAGHTWTVSGLDFSPDGLKLASCSIDGTARLWDVK